MIIDQNDFNLVNEEQIQVFVGKNGSGKTYSFNNALNLDMDRKIMLIDEEGIPHINNGKAKVKITSSKEYYFYDDEKNKGQPNSIEGERVVINDVSRKVIEYAETIILKIRVFKNLSKGQEKIRNIINIFTEYNLNDIKYIFFDEPENYLDEQYMLELSNFINFLVESGYKIRIATHSPKLLYLLPIAIDKIYLLTFFDGKCKIFNITNDEIDLFYEECASAIELKRKENPDCGEDSGIKYKLNIFSNHDVFDIFKRRVINSEELYGCLFFDQIIIVEGVSDKVAVDYVKHSFGFTTQDFSPNGKAFIPFFIRLFTSLGKRIIVIIDEDDVNKHSYAITKYIEERKNKDILVVLHNPDIEGEYGIWNDEVLQEKIKMPRRLEKSGDHKYFSSALFFLAEEKQELLKKNIGLKENIREDLNFA